MSEHGFYVIYALRLKPIGRRVLPLRQNASSEDVGAPPIHRLHRGRQPFDRHQYIVIRERQHGAARLRDAGQFATTSRVPSTELLSMMTTSHGTFAGTAWPASAAMHSSSTPARLYVATTMLAFMESYLLSDSATSRRKDSP